MKVVHISNWDLRGRRYNGYDILSAFEREGATARMIVLYKLSQNEAVTGLLDQQSDLLMHGAIEELEKREGVSRILFPWLERIVATPAFQEADVVHWHLPHTGVLSTLDYPRAFAQKPSVWTIHDSFAFTAHCVQPQDCDKWKYGCVDCPHPNRFFGLDSRRSAAMWSLKERVYSDCDVETVVATDRLEERYEESPLFRKLGRVHKIPFGVRWPYPTDKRSARKRLSIEADRFVILFRSVDSPLKGLAQIKEALSTAPPARPTTILATDGIGHLDSLKRHYDLREYGWVDDDEYALLLAAADVVLAPYPWAVGFGLFAVEAMAASRAVIGFSDTSIAEVTHAPSVGLAAQNLDPGSLRSCIDRLMLDPVECEHRGRMGRALVDREYSVDTYVRRLMTLYKQVIDKRSSPS